MLYGWKKNSMLEREFDAYKLSRCMCPSIYNCFWDKARYLWKNRRFHVPQPQNVSPGDAPGAIMLNVVWMETEYDAYKLSRCICPSNYNCFWDRARYWSKIAIVSYPPCIRRPRYRNSLAVTTIVYPGHLRSWSMRQFFRIGPRIDSHKGNFF